LWTFIVRNGSPFNLQVPGNPNLTYRGGLDILKAVLTDEGADELAAVAEDNGCTVEKTVEEAEIAEEERKALLGVQRQDHVWPSANCPECAWFDLQTANNCGADDWPSESQESLHDHSEKARNDLAACPLSKTVQIRLT